MKKLTVAEEIELNKAKVYEYYAYIDEPVEGTNEAFGITVLKSLTQSQRHLLHNMRTQAVALKLSLDPSDSDFQGNWNKLTGQISTLTTLIGD